MRVVRQTDVCRRSGLAVMRTKRTRPMRFHQKSHEEAAQTISKQKSVSIREEERQEQWMD